MIPIRRYLALLTLCGALDVGGGGCVLVSQNPFDLTPRDVATLQVKFGPDLTAAPRGALEAAVEQLTQIDVASLKVGKNKVTVIPTPAALEIGRRAVPSLIDNILANPTTVDGDNRRFSAALASPPCLATIQK